RAIRICWKRLECREQGRGICINSITCPYSLVVEEPEPSQLWDRTTAGAAKNILQQTCSLANASSISKPFVCIKRVIAMGPVTLPMKVFRAALNDQPERAPALASLRRVVQRRGDLHFLERAGIGQRYRIEVSKVEIVNVDSLK